MANSALPETVLFATRLAQLADGPLWSRNLDVSCLIRQRTPRALSGLPPRSFLSPLAVLSCGGREFRRYGHWHRGVIIALRLWVYAKAAQVANERQARRASRLSLALDARLYGGAGSL